MVILVLLLLLIGKASAGPLEQVARFNQFVTTSVGESERPWIRAFWSPHLDSSPELPIALALAVNQVNLGDGPASIYLIPDSELAWIDLRDLASEGDADELQQISQAWDKLIAEPYFHVPQRAVATGPVGFKDEVVPDLDENGNKQFFVQDGKRFYKTKRIRTPIQVELDSNPLPAPYLGSIGEETKGLLLSQVPIVRAERAIVQLTVPVNYFGIDGLYYDFHGLEPGKTKLRSYLHSLGAPQELIEELFGFSAVLIPRSEVTGKVRLAKFFRNVGTPVTQGTGLSGMTFDFRDSNDGDPKNSPLYNLTLNDSDGFEVQVETGNGVVYSAWDANGNLVREVPPDLVADHNVPAPHTKRLVPGKSCIICHGRSDRRGWPSVPRTDALDALVASGYEPLGSADGSPRVARQVAAEFRGDPQNAIDLARIAYGNWVFQVTGVTDEVAEDGTTTRNTVEIAVGSYEKIFNEFLFDQVTTEDACVELGLDPGDNPLGVLNQACPPFVGEGPIVALLRAGVSVNRQDFEPVYQAMMLRIVQVRAGLNQ